MRARAAFIRRLREIGGKKPIKSISMSEQFAAEFISQVPPSESITRLTHDFFLHRIMKSKLEQDECPFIDTCFNVNRSRPGLWFHIEV